jgi:hypothetical protein
MKQFVFTLFAVVIAPGTIWAGGHHHSGHGIMHAPIMEGSISTGHMMGLSSGPMVAPPPVTVGPTYSRASHPIPVDEHPRSAMLAVRDQETVKFLRAQRMGGFRMKNGIWLFEANRPLFPGLEHVIRVEARHDEADIQPYKVKFVRLIPGRIVYLDF